MNGSQHELNCPRCGTRLTGRSGNVCLQCNEDLEPDLDERGDSGKDTAAKANFHQIMTLVLLFLPAFAAAMGLWIQDIGSAMVLVSPLFGAWAGLHLGFALYHSRGWSKLAGIRYAVIGAFVCPMLTFFGCLVGI